MKQALKGIKVVELGDFISAPYCSKLLADLGAEVVKVERPSGDSARRHGPFPGDVSHLEKSGLFLYLNTNKLGISLNIESPEGRNVLRDLLDKADVLVENVDTQLVKKLDLDYASIRETNPDLIVTSITPFGRHGPYANRKAYDINLCALGDVSSCVGEPGRTPLATPCFQSEYQGGMAGIAGTLVALLARRQTGKGQHVDISIFDIWCTLHPGSKLLNFVYFGGICDRRQGRRRELVGPVFFLPCRDGYVGIDIIEDHQWESLAKILDVPELISNPRYLNRRAAVENYIEELEAILIPRLKRFTQDELFTAARKAGVPLAPVRTIDKVVNCEHLGERDYFMEIDHAVSGKLQYPGAPYRLSYTPANIGNPAPLLGEHNYDVFSGWLGYSKAEQSRLQQTGVI